MLSYLKGTFVVGAMVFAATTASAITVPPGDQLIVQLSGTYATQSGNPLGEGETLDLTNITVTDINAPGTVDLDGLTVGSSVTPSGAWVFDDGAVNNGFELTLLGTSLNSVFTLADAFNLVVPALPTGVSSLDGLGNLDGNAGSWSFSTSGVSTGGGFNFAFAVPPVVAPPIPLPAGLPLLLGALGGLALLRKRRGG